MFALSNVSVLFIAWWGGNCKVRISVHYWILGTAGPDLEQFLKHIFSVKNVLFLL